MFLATFLFLGISEIAIILVIAIVVFGPQKLPEIARGLAQGIRTMREATEEIKREVLEQTEDILPTKEIQEAKKDIETTVRKTEEDIEDSLGSIKRDF